MPDRLKENVLFCVFQQVGNAVMDGLQAQLRSYGSKLGAVRFAGWNPVEGGPCCSDYTTTPPQTLPQ